MPACRPTVVVRKPQGRVTGQKAMMESTCQGRVTRCNNKSGCSALWCEVVWCGVENAMRSLSPYGWRTLPQFQSCSSAKVSSRSRTQLLCYISGASAHFLATALPLQSSEKRGEKKKTLKNPYCNQKTTTTTTKLNLEQFCSSRNQTL